MGKNVVPLVSIGVVPERQMPVHSGHDAKLPRTVYAIIPNQLFVKEGHRLHIPDV